MEQSINVGYILSLINIGSEEDHINIGIFASKELADEQARIVYDSDMYDCIVPTKNSKGEKIPYYTWLNQYTNIDGFKISDKTFNSYSELDALELY